MLTAVLVDDEIGALESLLILLQNIKTGVNVLGTASNISDGYTLIRDTDPDIVFLDIEMSNGTGFDLLDMFEEYSFRLIFVTAYNQYALRAFRYAAIDYLLKPIDIDNLEEAVQRVVEISPDKTNSKINVLNTNWGKDNPEEIIVTSSDTVEVIKITNIIQIIAEWPYSRIVTITDGVILALKPIGEYENILVDCNFYRTHKSHLVSMSHIESINKSSGLLKLTNNSIAHLSRRKKLKFFELFNEFNKKNGRKNAI